MLAKDPKFFQNTWEKIIFIGSIIGLLFLAFITFYREYKLKNDIGKNSSNVSNSNK